MSLVDVVATALSDRGSPRPALPVYVRLRDVEQLVHYTNVHLHRLEKAGKFPARVRLGPGRVVWKLDTILEWIEARRAESAPAAM